MERKNCPPDTCTETPKPSANIFCVLTSLVIGAVKECGSIEQRIEAHKSRL